MKRVAGVLLLVTAFAVIPSCNNFMGGEADFTIVNDFGYDITVYFGH